MTRIFSRIVISVIPCMILANVAVADWQYTKWGMSSEELVSIGRGNVAPTTYDALFKGDTMNGRRGSALDVNADSFFISGYNAEGINFTAIDYFRSDRL